MNGTACLVLSLASRAGHEDGTQYVGSAYGRDCVVGRWRSYAKEGHGHNKKLVELVETSADAPGCFEFAILQTLPTTLTAREVIEYEKLHKYKLARGRMD